MYSWRSINDYDSLDNAAGTPGTDDLAIVGGTFGTDHPTLQVEDLAGGGTAVEYARTEIILPAEYVGAASVILRVRAGCLTQACAVDCSVSLTAHSVDKDNTVSAQLATAPAGVDMNSTTFADFDFAITATNLEAGEILDVKIGIDADNTGGDATETIPCIGAVDLRCGVKG
jgi:hypothetical protein